MGSLRLPNMVARLGQAVIKGEEVMARIGSVSLDTGSQYVVLTGPGKLHFRISGADNVRIAFDQFSLDNGPYFTLDNGTTYIYDEPNPFVGQNCFIRADSSTATFEWMVTGGGIE